jgi:hypothetical protein
MTWWLMNDESRGVWKEATVAYVKVLSQHLSEGTEKNNSLSESGRPPAQRYDF